MPFAVVLASLVVSGVAAAFLAAGGAGDQTTGSIAAAVFSLALLVGGILLRARLPRHERENVTRAKLPMVGAIAVGVGFGLAFRIGIGMITALGDAVDPSLCEKLKDATDIIPPAMWQKVLLAFLLVILAPFGEELLFRGILLRGFARAMPFAWATIVAGILFGLAHPQYYATWPLLIGMCAFGVLAGVIYRAFGYPTNVAMHLVFNGIAAVFLFVDAPETDCPTR